MPRLFLIRHAEPAAAWGSNDGDPGLSALGRAQAEDAARALATIGPTAIICSPMRRCQETAKPSLDRTGLKLRLEPSVSEVVAPPEVTNRRAWLEDNFPWTTPDARRSWASVDPRLRAWRDRVVGAIATLREDTAVFSHFIAINAIVGAALQRNETIVCRPGHASITELYAEAGALHLVRLGAQVTDGDVR